MTHFVSVRASDTWTFAHDYPNPANYLEITWAAHLPSQHEIVVFHDDLAIPLLPAIRIIADEVRELDRALLVEVGCEFEHGDHAMLFKLKFAEAA